MGDVVKFPLTKEAEARIARHLPKEQYGEYYGTPRISKGDSFDQYRFVLKNICDIPIKVQMGQGEKRLDPGEENMFAWKSKGQEPEKEKLGIVISSALTGPQSPPKTKAEGVERKEEEKKKEYPY